MMWLMPRPMPGIAFNAKGETHLVYQVTQKWRSLVFDEITGISHSTLKQADGTFKDIPLQTIDE